MKPKGIFPSLQESIKYWDFLTTWKIIEPQEGSCLPHEVSYLVN
jgi:hypothetical protein